MCARNIDWPTSMETKQCFTKDEEVKHVGIHYVNENKNFDGLQLQNLHFQKNKSMGGQKSDQPLSR